MSTILIADEDDLVLSMLSVVLHQALKNCDLLFARNGKEAAEILSSRPVDAIVTDLQISLMDGYELIALARNKNSGVVVFVMTRVYTDEVLGRLRSLGVVRFFKKPFSIAELAQALENALQ